jgi:hypothetical protein
MKKYLVTKQGLFGSSVIARSRIRSEGDVYLFVHRTVPVYGSENYIDIVWMQIESVFYLGIRSEIRLVPFEYDLEFTQDEFTRWAIGMFTVAGVHDS